MRERQDTRTIATAMMVLAMCGLPGCAVEDSPRDPDRERPAAADEVSETTSALSVPEGLVLAMRANDASNLLMTTSSANVPVFRSPTPSPEVSLQSSPALAMFQGKLYVTFKANDASNALYVTASEDGMVFPLASRTVDSTPDSPAIAAFQNRLYIAFRANDSSNALYITSSADGRNFVPGQRLAMALDNSPALAVFQNRLYVAFKSNNANNQLCVTSSPDGAAFTAPICYGGILLQNSPALAAFQGRLYVAFKANDPSNRLFVTSASDGVNFQAPATGYDGIRIANSPAMTATGDRLYIAFKANDSSNILFVTSSTDGRNFGSPASAVNNVRFQGSPAMTTMTDGQARSAPTLAQLQSYVERYAPVVMLHPDDTYRPDTVDAYLQNTALVGGLVYNEDDYDRLTIVNSALYSSSTVRTYGLGTLVPWLRQYLQNNLAGADIFAWSSGGPIAGMTCTLVNEPGDPDTWSDNYFCNRLGIPFRWSYDGPIDGMRCVQLVEPSEPGSHGWDDNYLCHNTEIDFQWSYGGPISGKTCISFNEPSDPHTWNDNYLCYSPFAGPIKFWLTPDTNQDEVRRGNLDRAKSYVSVSDRGTYLTLQYWYFYPYNGPGRFELCLLGCDQYQISTVGRHEGDWEHVDVDVYPSGGVADVRLSRHGDAVGAFDQVAWDRSHPVVYSAFYSHAHYPGPGTQYYKRAYSLNLGVTTLSVDLFDRTAGGPRWSSAQPGKYEIVKVTGVPGVSGSQPDWASFLGRWGGYERLSHTHSVSYLFGSYDYTQTEVGAGPSTPGF